jgi:hypothetical protein
VFSDYKLEEYNKESSQSGGLCLRSDRLKLYHYSNDVKRFVLFLDHLSYISSIKSYPTYAILFRCANRQVQAYKK